ncbi:MAG: hypothetical protein ACFFCS_17695 [Candidatus Hodarchaeota archaeon]
MSDSIIEEKKQEERKDLQLLWIGILFSIGFTVLIGFLGVALPYGVVLLEDKGATWYYWKLPAPQFWPIFTSWAFYLAHQITIWYLTWKGMKKLKAKKPWQSTPDKVHYQVLAANLGFVILHLVQSQIWYDGLAQTVPIWSSQFSVIGMLILILVMMSPTRGWFWGKKLKIGKDAMKGMYKWHGYYITWALVYTFWFHPMDTGIALTFGFFYMFLLLFQSSTFLMKVHLGRKWITLLEVIVWIHGTTVAIESDYIRKASSSGISWPIFFFGFLGLFVFTQQFGIIKKKWANFLLLGIYIALIVITYSIIGWDSVWQVVSIPMVEYLLIFVTWGLFALVPGLKKGRWKKKQSEAKMEVKSVS